MGRGPRRMFIILAALLVIPACAGDSGSKTGTSASGDERIGDDDLNSEVTGSALGSGQPPFVRIVSPSSGITVHEGATINVQAVAIDPDTEIVRVDFFDGTRPIGARSAAPFILAWGGLTAGTHLLTVVALDVQGLSSVSAPV